MGCGGAPCVAAARRGFTRETKVDGSRPGAPIVGKSSAPVREIMVCGFWKSPRPLRRRAPTRHPRQRPLASWLELSCCGEIRQSASTRDESGDAGDCKGISHLGRGLTAEADLLGGGQQRHRGRTPQLCRGWCNALEMRRACRIAPSTAFAHHRRCVLAHAWQGSADGRGFQNETSCLRSARFCAQTPRLLPSAAIKIEGQTSACTRCCRRTGSYAVLMSSMSSA